ncbi:hypothetical protein A2609_01820 [Candidatus Kaiserbacteria bacterium RIFOXYD1_FULL_47_14]|uniref:Uncharacterized protein n=1 Tax=Candidatus Kaiserbacteria bacterium RIFOXYD1_FULL_47_14 TaxID=1798533 RepID=A0A1F6G5Q7_9BACT|nr:MAG: hypothetical protein A2609_01820 [Candidatus Kaiserbacteria bacterium RIFOXYD1_FULL_47_14]
MSKKDKEAVMSSELKFSWPEESAPGNNAFYPLSIPGEIARIVTADDSRRDEGGCIAPSIEGLLVILRDDGKYEIRDFSFFSRRGWDSNSSWLDRRGEIGPARLSDSLPAFLWRTCKSAYYVRGDEARAEVEVVYNPTPEWLVAEMEATGEDMRDSRNGIPPIEMAEEMLRQREQIFFEAISEEEPICSSLRGVWLERSRMDIRALAIRWLIRKRIHREIELRFFADSRPPRWETSYGGHSHSFEELFFQGMGILQVPIGTRAKWRWK